MLSKMKEEEEELEYANFCQAHDPWVQRAYNLKKRGGGPDEVDKQYAEMQPFFSSSILCKAYIARDKYYLEHDDIPGAQREFERVWSEELKKEAAKTKTIEQPTKPTKIDDEQTLA